MGKIEDHLPWREEIDLLDTGFIKGETLTSPGRLDDAAGKYADDVIENGNVTPGQRDELITALRRAGLFYYFGDAVTLGIASNKETAKTWRRAGHKIAADLLKPRPKHRPKQYFDQGLIWVMADAWEYFGHEAKSPAYHPGTRTRQQGDYPNEFVQFCEGWIRVIDPDRRGMPKRTLYRRVLDQRSENTDV
ncbi:MAG: hypothetical protein O7I42_04805 [Alphaproteobacteria bacterium]|nr:hypothetical protein [Alphaproteobacteria bacterium]